MNWKHLFSILIYLVHIFVSCVPGRNSISSISGYHLNNCCQGVKKVGKTESEVGSDDIHLAWLVPPPLEIGHIYIYILNKKIDSL